jgi:hypothetical protein
MASTSKPAEAVARPAARTYLAEGDTARVLIPRQVGEGHDAIGVRRNPKPNSERRWLLQLNGHPPFSISHRQLLSPLRFRTVAVYQLSRLNKHIDRFLPDLVRLPEVGWRDIMERLIAPLLTAGGSE